MGFDASSVPPVPSVPPVSKKSTKSCLQTALDAATAGKGQVKYTRKVTFGPDRTAIPIVASPKTVSGVIKLQDQPAAQFQRTLHEGPGYLRIQGSVKSTNRWHNYDTYVPTAEFLSASPAQQANMVDALKACQWESIPQSHLAQDQPDIGQIGIVQKALTETNLKANSKSSSDGMTSISRRPCKPTAAPTTIAPPTAAIAATQALATTVKPAENGKSGGSDTCSAKTKSRTNPEHKLRCCSCGEPKRPGVDNVKEIKGKVPLCWRCLLEFEGSDGVRKWLAGVP